MHGLVDPAQVLGDAGVDAVCSLTAAFKPPADDSSSPEAVIVAYSKRTSTVPLARVLPSFGDSGTKHVFCQARCVWVSTFLLGNWSSAFLLVHHRKMHILELVSQDPSVLIVCDSKAWDYSANQEEETFKSRPLRLCSRIETLYNVLANISDSFFTPYARWSASSPPPADIVA